MAVTAQDLQRAHNEGQKDESEDRSDCYQGLKQVFYSEEEREAYQQGVANAQEQKNA